MARDEKSGFWMACVLPNCTTCLRASRVYASDERNPVRPLPVAASIAQFLATLQSHPEASAGLSQSLTAWLSYYRILETVRGAANPSTTASLRRHFSPLATALLDQMADTVCHFFALPWLQAERTHTRLTRALPGICTEQRLDGDTAGLQAMMRELHERLGALDTSSSVSSALGAVGVETHTQPADLSEILACIDQYLVALLHFFEQNRAHSILHHTTHSEEA